MPLDPNTIRNQFPALRRQAELEQPAIFFDNPGGTQIARQSLERINEYLTQHNANHGGAFASSIESDAVLEEAHAAMADFYNAARPEEIVFGNNMTTLTLHISRSISRNWNPGDTIVVTRLDHDANVTPWVLAAQDRGVNVRWVDFDVEDGTLNLDDFAAAMETRPRLVALGYASNALGTINPVATIIRRAHEAGALVLVDAAQSTPHEATDVQAWDADFVAFRDINPKAPQHLLVVPREHIVSLNDLDGRPGDLGHRLLRFVVLVAQHVGIGETGYRALTNVGPDGGQEVQHLHFHVLGGEDLGDFR